MVIGAGLCFAAVFPGCSFLINRRLCGGTLVTDLRGIALLSGLVFVIAMCCEATINPVYEYFHERKLWEYRLFPLHDGNLSALAVLVWTSYGVHLYFLNQYLDRLFAGKRRRVLYKGMLIGAEAPLLWEVLGNGFFLLLVGEYYAYYNPGELFHLTSLQVVPIYMVCVTIGLLVYEWVKRQDLGWRTTGLLYAAGAGFLAVG